MANEMEVEEGDVTFDVVCAYCGARFDVDIPKQLGHGLDYTMQVEWAHDCSDAPA